MTDFPWTFAEVQNFFAWRFALPDSRRTALRGRIQNLQKNGIPASANTGRGKPAQYGLTQMVELSIAMELLDLGFPPDLTIEIVRSERALVFETLEIGTDSPSYFGVDAPKESLFVLSTLAKKMHLLPRLRSVTILTPKEFAQTLVERKITLGFPIAVLDLQGIVFKLKDWFVLHHPKSQVMRELLARRASGFLDNSKSQST